MSAQKLPSAGEKIPVVSKGPITLDMLKLYARASGDYNPIHTDEATALKVGLPGIIAHGMLSAGFLASRANEAMKPWANQWTLSSFQSRFKGMTFLGDTVTLAGVFKSVSADSICLELSASNSKGDVTTQAFVEYKPTA